MHRAALGAVKYNLSLSPPVTSLPVNCLVLRSEESGILQEHPHPLHLEQQSSLTNLAQRQGKAALRWDCVQRMFAAAHRCVKCGSGSKIIIIIIIAIINNNNLSFYLREVRKTTSNSLANLAKLATLYWNLGSWEYPSQICWPFKKKVTVA